jgi:hypothetical protein
MRKPWTVSQRPCYDNLPQNVDDALLIAVRDNRLIAQMPQVTAVSPGPPYQFGHPFRNPKSAVHLEIMKSAAILPVEETKVMKPVLR